MYIIFASYYNEENRKGKKIDANTLTHVLAFFNICIVTSKERKGKVDLFFFPITIVLRLDCNLNLVKTKWVNKYPKLM
jgi:hypothetical protein